MNITPFITNGGMAHLNRIAVLGQPLTITSARLGAGRLSFTSEAERELLSVERSSLVDERASARVARCELREGIYSIVVQVESADIQEELYVWELGLYVEGESGEDVLFCYVSFSDAPDWIPPGSVAQYVRDYEIGIALSTENAAMTVSPAALVRAERFDAHLNDQSNPHRVEPNQIGALPINGSGVMTGPVQCKIPSSGNFSPLYGLNAVNDRFQGIYAGPSYYGFRVNDLTGSGYAMLLLEANDGGSPKSGQIRLNTNNGASTSYFRVHHTGATRITRYTITVPALAANAETSLPLDFGYTFDQSVRALANSRHGAYAVTATYEGLSSCTLLIRNISGTALSQTSITITLLATSIYD